MLVASKRGKLKFEHNMAINESFVYTNFEDPRSFDRDLRNQKTGKNGHFLCQNFVSVHVRYGGGLISKHPGL